MTNKALLDAFSVLETQIGLRRTSDQPIVFESDTHRVSIDLLDRHSTVSCELVLKALLNATVDAYSIISVYDAGALKAFLSSSEMRTDENVARFVAREMAGPCASVFRVTSTSDWMQLHQKHLQSERRRNEVFWRRVSGFDDGATMTEQATY